MKVATVVLTLLTCFGSAVASERPALNQPMPLRTSNEILLPANYRSWVAVAPESAGMSAHQRKHVVGKIYVEPKAYESFLKHSTWPEQTVIVLELRDKAAPPHLPCDGVIGLEVAAKNGAGALEPWSYYGIIYDHDKQARKASTDKAMCKHCSSDPANMQFAMFFPALRAVIHATPETMQPLAF